MQNSLKRLYIIVYYELILFIKSIYETVYENRFFIYTSGQVSSLICCNILWEWEGSSIFLSMKLIFTKHNLKKGKIMLKYFPKTFDFIFS